MGRSDFEVVRHQLGRTPENFRRVVFRCPFGYPVVIESHPVKDGRPFPTLYWLTCPFLRREVSRLEEEGLIRKIERIVEEDPIFRDRLFRAHEEIVRRRSEIVEDEGMRRILSRVGSGGIRDWRHVKCLHLHLADYLAGIDNPVGELVWKKLDVKFCDLPMCSGYEGGHDLGVLDHV